MKKLLPTSHAFGVNKSKGFTLVELLVVISIIAVLSVIGFTLFTGAQKSARDAVRRQEIDAIANALETNYDNGTAKYVALANGQFTSGAVPSDDYTGKDKCGTNGDVRCEYCGRTTPGAAMTKGQNQVGGCTAGGSKIDTSIPATDTAFEVCATLETSPYFYCKVNQR